MGVEAARLLAVPEEELDNSVASLVLEFVNCEGLNPVTLSFALSHLFVFVVICGCFVPLS